MDVLREQALPLLECLWQTPGAWGEIRLLKPQQEAKRPLFVPLPLKPLNLSLAFDWTRRENAAKNNSYMSVHPRRTPRGRNEDVESYTALIADLDDAEKSWPEVLKLAGAGAPPSACVRTTRGVHLYWFLKQPELVTDETRGVMVRLQTALHSDKVHDPARIFRLPGTMCWKGDVPHAIYLAWLNPEKRYTTQEIDEALRGVWPTLTATHQTKPDAPILQALCEQPKGFDPSLWAHYSSEWPKGTRSEQCLGFILAAMWRGWSDEEIRTTLSALPIGQHYTDRGISGTGSLCYDIARARQKVNASRGHMQRVTITRTGLVQELDAYKLRVWLTTDGDNGAPSTTLCEWLTVPSEAAPVRIRTRWNAFLGAVGLHDPKVAPATFDALVGRPVLVELKEDRGRAHAVWFGPL